MSIFRQIGYWRGYFRIDRVDVFVGGMAQRDDLDVETKIFQGQDFLGNECL